jgi:hypothetical protein
VVRELRLRGDPTNQATPLRSDGLDSSLVTLWKKEVYDGGEEWIGRGS